MRLIERLRTLRGESGYAMVTVMGVLLVATTFSMAALAASQNDINPSRKDVDRKSALAAAEAGVNYYQYHLNEDNNFWAMCTDVEESGATTQEPVNQPWNGSGADPRVWRNVPDSPDAQYTVELLPATGTTCSTANPAGSMINTANGTFRVRATGRSSARRGGGWEYRTIVATFRRRGFLDFLYFTDFETSPPSRYGSEQGWASTACARYVRDGRLSQRSPSGTECTNIQFAPEDVVNGPLHTNDNILVCGNPTFGRTTDSQGNAVKDSVEVSDPNSPGYRNACSGSPNVRPSGNALKFDQPLLTLPPSNTSLANIVKPEYKFTGTTTIRLKGSTMDVTDYPGGTLRTQNNMQLPSNGVIYVASGNCNSGAYNPDNPYGTGTGCAIAYVSGEYSRNLTITSERDIVVRPLPADPDNSGVKRATSSDAMLGLIGNDHVRVFHNPQTDSNLNDSDCENNTTNGTKDNIRIDAAILALNYSFIVDYYNCGPPRDNLTVNGVIAQKFRGPVGTGGSSGNSTGYIKQYSYDDRLVYRSPPFFLDPVQSAWQVVRYNEQVPAVSP